VIVNMRAINARSDTKLDVATHFDPDSLALRLL
jgi:hypothetical protein